MLYYNNITKKGSFLVTNLFYFRTSLSRFSSQYYENYYHRNRFSCSTYTSILLHNSVCKCGYVYIPREYHQRRVSWLSNNFPTEAQQVFKSKQQAFYFTDVKANYNSAPPQPLCARCWV